MSSIHFIIILWGGACFFALMSILKIVQNPKVKAVLFGLRAEQRGLQEVIVLLQELEETLAAGILPLPEKWSGLLRLAPPWGRLTFDSVQELRSQGSPVLPTLNRLRKLAQDHRESLLGATSKTAQALLQALVAGILVPVFGGILYLLLPGVSERPWLWIFVCLIGMVLSGVAALWMLVQANSARWGGLGAQERSSILAAQCAGERLLALIRGGAPADIAWTRAMEFLTMSAPVLSQEWGCSAWATTDVQAGDSGKVGQHSGRHHLLALGPALRQAIQVSVMEGRPCTERIETALKAFRQDFDGVVDREMALLGTRVLKPIFLLVAPAIFGLLGVGLFLSWIDMAAGGGFGV